MKLTLITIPEEIFPVYPCEEGVGLDLRKIFHAYSLRRDFVQESAQKIYSDGAHVSWYFKLIGRLYIIK